MSLDVRADDVGNAKESGWQDDGRAGRLPAASFGVILMTMGTEGMIIRE
ncbi:hypothetical protein AB0O54_20360 [Pseudarthrobacter oxydans]